MKEGMTFQDCLGAMRQRLEGCQDISELRTMQEIMRDVLMKVIPFLINNTKGVKKRATLRRAFFEIATDRT